MPRLPNTLTCLALATQIGVLPLDALAATRACHAESPPQQTPLVELFTSDGCSSCPPANRWLSATLAQPDRPIIPLSLHVTYWNHLGWEDAFSAPLFDQRQDWYAKTAINRFPYTPELFRNGREWQGWRGADAANPAPAKRAPVVLQLEQIPAGESALNARIRVQEAEAHALSPSAHWQLVVVLYEDGLSEQPDAGELRGHRLQHDHVARVWQTIDRPLFGQAYDLRFTSPTGSQMAHTGLVAFLQDRGDGAIVQAVDLPACR